MEIGQIINGHVNELLNLNDDISKKRLQICKSCPIYSSQFGGICNSKLWINPVTEDVSVSKYPGYVRGCGCRLKAKTRLPNASCIIDKW